MKSFASDNYSGVHPEIMEAIQKANRDHTPSYGSDEYTTRAIEKFKACFGDDIEVFFVYNGTGANVLGLSALTRSYHSIICQNGAHINVDESTAPEKFTGCKLVTVPSRNGKLDAHEVEKRIQRLGDQHHPQAKVISISQASEYGTVYSIDEVLALSAIAKKYNLYLHMDGARIANAAVTLGAPFHSFTREAGVDVLSFGGAKNGMMFGEAIVFFDKVLAENFQYVRKQGMQLNSKMRFISAQFDALLSNQLWKRNASKTNLLAQKLASGLSSIPQVEITQSVQANGVFAIIPQAIIQPLQQIFPFYVWNEVTNEVRLMCSWDTTDEEVDQLIQEVKRLLNQ
jgi:threonine aldolase